MGNNTRKNLRKKTVKKRLGNKLKKRGRKAKPFEEYAEKSQNEIDKLRNKL